MQDQELENKRALRLGLKKRLLAEERYKDYLTEACIVIQPKRGRNNVNKEEERRETK